MVKDIHIIQVREARGKYSSLVKSTLLLTYTTVDSVLLDLKHINFICASVLRALIQL